MDHKLILPLSVVLSLVAWGCASPSLARHNNLQAQADKTISSPGAGVIIQPGATPVYSPTFTGVKKKKPKSNVAKQVEKLRQAYYAERDADPLDWDGGTPDPDDIQEHLAIVSKYLGILKGLTPVTKNDTKAYRRFLGGLANEQKSLVENLFHAEREDIEEAMSLIYNMDEDSGDLSTYINKIAEFEKVLAQWLAFQQKAASQGYKRIAREAGDRVTDIKQSIGYVKENYANATRPPEAEHESVSSSTESPPESPPPGMELLSNLDQGRLEDDINNFYGQNPLCPGVLNVSDCIGQVTRAGGDLTPFANILVQAASLQGATISFDQALAFLKTAAANVSASVYRSLGRSLRAQVDQALSGGGASTGGGGGGSPGQGFGFGGGFGGGGFGKQSAVKTAIMNVMTAFGELMQESFGQVAVEDLQDLLNQISAIPTTKKSEQKMVTKAANTIKKELARAEFNEAMELVREGGPDVAAADIDAAKAQLQAVADKYAGDRSLVKFVSRELKFASRDLDRMAAMAARHDEFEKQQTAQEEQRPPFAAVSGQEGQGPGGPGSGGPGQGVFFGPGAQRGFSARETGIVAPQGERGGPGIFSGDFPGGPGIFTTGRGFGPPDGGMPFGPGGRFGHGGPFGGDRGGPGGGPFGPGGFGPGPFFGPGGPGGEGPFPAFMRGGFPGRGPEGGDMNQMMRQMMGDQVGGGSMPPMPTQGDMANINMQGPTAGPGAGAPPPPSSDGGSASPPPPPTGSIWDIIRFFFSR